VSYAPDKVLTSLLRDVSRSFYLTLRVLPASIRPQISLAYLLARTSDTIADTELVPWEKRLAALESLRQSVVCSSKATPEFAEFSRQQGSPAERALLGNSATALDLLRQLSSDDRELVIQVLKTIISGQELDLRRFHSSSSSSIAALESAAELDDYTYRVAGCVGEFWTRMCLAHVFGSARLDSAFLLKAGVRFGKGLQLVNVLRDLPVDLRQGRCYLPAGELRNASLKPADLLDPSTEPRMRPVYNQWLDVAESHLKVGWDYAKALPRSNMRTRLACAWPLLIGARTVRLLRTERVLDTDRRVKVSRAEVRRLLFRSVVCYPWPGKWDRLYDQTSSDH